MACKRSAVRSRLPPPSEQSEVVPKSGACSKKDFTNGCNVVRISVFAADETKLAEVSSKIKTDLKRLCPLRLEA